MDNEKISDSVLDSLRKYQKHHHALCLECGHSGAMGVKKEYCPWFVSWWAILTIVVLFSFFIQLTVPAVILAVLMAMLKVYLTCKIIVCPSCHNELITK